MNPNIHYRLIWANGYEIDCFGQVFNSDSGIQLKALTRIHAAKVWNQKSRARNFKGPFIDGIGTGRSKSNRARVTVNQLIQSDQVAWLYLSKEYHEATWKSGELPPASFMPEEWIPLAGDPDVGWVMATPDEYGTLFHGPSVAAYTMERSDGSASIGIQST